MVKPLQKDFQDAVIETILAKSSLDPIITQFQLTSIEQDLLLKVGKILENMRDLIEQDYWLDTIPPISAESQLLVKDEFKGLAESIITNLSLMNEKVTKGFVDPEEILHETRSFIREYPSVKLNPKLEYPIFPLIKWDGKSPITVKPERIEIIEQDAGAFSKGWMKEIIGTFFPDRSPSRSSIFMCHVRGLRMPMKTFSIGNFKIFSRDDYIKLIHDLKIPEKASIINKSVPIESIVQKTDNGIIPYNPDDFFLSFEFEIKPGQNPNFIAINLAYGFLGVFHTIYQGSFSTCKIAEIENAWIATRSNEGFHPPYPILVKKASFEMVLDVPDEDTISAHDIKYLNEFIDSYKAPLETIFKSPSLDKLDDEEQLGKRIFRALILFKRSNDEQDPHEQYGLLYRLLETLLVDDKAEMGKKLFKRVNAIIESKSIKTAAQKRGPLIHTHELGQIHKSDIDMLRFASFYALQYMLWAKKEGMSYEEAIQELDDDVYHDQITYEQLKTRIEKEGSLTEAQKNLILTGNRSTPARLIPLIPDVQIDVLFIGLNPPPASNSNGHYFSGQHSQPFWDQLRKAGLITKDVDKKVADILIFKGNDFNYKKSVYGITDLVPSTVHKESKYVDVTGDDCEKLIKLIMERKPRAVVLLHRKVQKKITSYLKKELPPNANAGNVGQLIDGCRTTFFAIAFPHGNSITDDDKVAKYKELKDFLDTEMKDS